MNNIRGENVMEEKEFNNDKKTVLIVDDEKPISGSIKEIRIVQNGKSCSVEIDGDYDEQGLISAIPSSADVVRGTSTPLTSLQNVL